MAHVDYIKRLCVCTDASNLLWSGIVTQVPITEIPYSILEQNQKHSAFLSGHFSE